VTPKEEKKTLSMSKKCEHNLYEDTDSNTFYAGSRMLGLCKNKGLRPSLIDGNQTLWCGFSVFVFAVLGLTTQGIMHVKGDLVLQLNVSLVLLTRSALGYITLW
jgi:hypothetical protein